MLNACLLSLNRGKILDIRPQTTAQSHMSKGRSERIQCRDGGERCRGGGGEEGDGEVEAKHWHRLCILI